MRKLRCSRIIMGLMMCLALAFGLDMKAQANVGNLTSYPITTTNPPVTNFSMYWTYSATKPDMVGFFDYKGRFNVAYVSGSAVVIQKYDNSMKLVTTMKLVLRYTKFGNITCDQNGNYYVVSGQDDKDQTGCVTMNIAKYGYEGNFIAECNYNREDTFDPFPDSTAGTQIPFRSGNCDITINNGVVAVNYARQMYNGHQSNNVIYADCATMQKLTGPVAYSSHSFDERIVSASDGSYLVLNHGDAYPRAFQITKIDAKRQRSSNIATFHFREGANRDHGYNETYAQLGSIAETKNAYIFCASSEKTLSLACAATGGAYCGHSEARNLFVQILNKDFNSFMSTPDMYKVKGQTRTVTGTRPSADGLLTELRLNGNEVDYGVIWLTDYDADSYVVNPKIVSLTDELACILWEKRLYSNTNYTNTYFMVIDEDGKVVVPEEEIPNVKLAGNTDPVVRDGVIYWVTNEYSIGSFVHALKIGTEAYAEPSDQIYAFVERMYTVALARPSDADGLQDWSVQLARKKRDGAGIAEGFFMSKEFLNKNHSNEAFLDILYKTFLNRNADLDGKNYWMNKLESGSTRRFVLAGFVNSPEFTEICENYGILRGNYDAGPEYGEATEQFVLRLYTKVLGRKGEPAGVADWVNRIKTKETTPELAAKGFFGSQEFIMKNLTNEDYVEILYQTFMDRESDAPGKADWVSRLAENVSREEVVEGFSRSTEFKKIMESFGL